VNYKVYSKYKDSGVEWLGEVPEHWEAVALKWISKRYAGGTPDKSNESYWEEGDIPWLNSGAVNDGYITTPSSFITKEGFAKSSAKWISEKALVMALAGQGKTKGMVAQVGIKTTCNQSMAAILPVSTVEPRFLCWWLVSNYQNIRNMAGGEQRDGLNLDIIGAIPCPLLPKYEQKVISNFLDHNAEKIDTLLAKKRALVEKLKEKRTAFISRTVTRGLPPEAALAAGLDPHPKLKPSGVEWLGDVPEHWRVKRLKFILKAKKGAIKTGPFGSQLQSSDMLNGEIKVYNQRNVLDNDVLGGENYISSEKFQELNAFEVYPGDILVTTRGTIGRCMIVPLDAEKGILHPCLMRIQAKQEAVCNRYLEFLIDQSGLVLEQLKIMSNATTIEVIYSQSLKEVWLPIPPTPEQESIIEYLDSETTKIDKLICKVESAIERLQEYRTALITAAVTGKIDVREI
jgi:type I restriction enzyme, S subunit